MNRHHLRQYIFKVHRYLGLAIALMIIIVGITGSLLVFKREVNDFLQHAQFGTIHPQGNRLSLDEIIDRVNQHFSGDEKPTINAIEIPQSPQLPTEVWLENADKKWLQAWVHPYTGMILDIKSENDSFFNGLITLHYSLFMGEFGVIFVGIVSLFFIILIMTGLYLWPGWRKLSAGFKIKWQAPVKRKNFDIHKVVGFVCAIFLLILTFTGVCWNFSSISEPLIYALTFTPVPLGFKSEMIPGQAPLKLSEVYGIANTVIPQATITQIQIPDAKDGVFRVRKKHPQDHTLYRGMSFITLDQYSGRILQVQDATQPNRAVAIINNFIPLHFGTYWGGFSRILYVLVGVSPLILFITAWQMFIHRYKSR